MSIECRNFDACAPAERNVHSRACRVPILVDTIKPNIKNQQIATPTVRYDRKSTLAPPRSNRRSNQAGTEVNGGILPSN